MKKLRFAKIEELAGVTGEQPVPTIRAIPEWLKKMRPSREPAGKRGHFTSPTVKACSPFLDSMSLGYVIKTEVDILVELDNNGDQHITWHSGWTMVDKHVAGQIAKEQVPEGYSQHAFKWINPYIVETPKGYSSLFVHPLNRTDLPFHTLSGTVDTDLYYGAVHFPFLIRANFSGIIPAGTPIAQVIPVKREQWEHELVIADTQKATEVFHKLRARLTRSYKSQWWQRKTYN